MADLLMQYGSPRSYECSSVQNALPFSANLQLGGGFRQLHPAVQGSAVEPGQSQTYMWQVPPTLGPGQQDFSTVAYTYRSTVDPTAHENAGLIGAVVIGRLVSPTPYQLSFRTFRWLTRVEVTYILSPEKMLTCESSATTCALSHLLSHTLRFLCV